MFLFTYIAQYFGSGSVLRYTHVTRIGQIENFSTLYPGLPRIKPKEISGPETLRLRAGHPAAKWPCRLADDKLAVSERQASPGPNH